MFWNVDSVTEREMGTFSAESLRRHDGRKRWKRDGEQKLARRRPVV